MDEPLIINRTTPKTLKILTLFNYIILVIFGIFMYIGYSHMLDTMNSMLKNTYAMCNMTHLLTSAPATCYY